MGFKETITTATRKIATDVLQVTSIKNAKMLGTDAKGNLVEKTNTGTGTGTDIVSQLQINTSFATNDLIQGHKQNGKHIMIKNGSGNVTVMVNSSDKFSATYQKTGTGNVTFTSNTVTIEQVDNTNVINGKKGSSATVSIVGNTAYIRIANTE